MHTPKMPAKDSIYELGEAQANIVPTDKRVRVFSGGKVLADSKETLILRMTRKPVAYCFPEKDVKFSELDAGEKGEDEIGEFMSYRLRGHDTIQATAAKNYTDTGKIKGVLNGYTLFDAKAVEKLMEEDETITGHPRDPYTRIDVLQSNTRVEYIMKGRKIVDSERVMKLFETGLPVRYYIHPDDVDKDVLFPSKSETFCPYKGKATYWDLKIDGEVFHDMVWSYLEPYEEAMKVKGYFSFYMDRLDKVLVGGSE